MAEITRRFQLMKLQVQIAINRRAMEEEPGVTPQWRFLMIQHLEYMTKLHQLRTAGGSGRANDKGFI